MPNLQDELHDLHGSEVFATLDFCQGCWQIHLHKDSQDFQSFITPDGVYTPTRVLHGTRNATQHLQSVIIVMMDDIKSNIKVWLDDCLLHTKTEDNLLAILKFFVKKCQEHGLKLHASKCVLFATTVRYFENLITKNGVRFDPKNMEALQTMQEPQNGADLVQYVAAVNWMRSAIPRYSKRVTPLQASLAKVFEGKSRRTTKAAVAVSLLHLWGPEEQTDFKYLHAAIMNSMTLAFPDPDKRICVLTDDSDRFYAGLVTQTDEEKMNLTMEEQDKQSLAILSGEFKGAQLQWTVPEKEDFAIVDTVAKVDYLLLSHDEFSILSDHLNLTYIYNPLSADPTLARHVVHKLQRWALKMPVFSYRMEHVMGELDYWTDLMARWEVGWVAGSENKAHGKMASLFA
jgi:RNase H-like domain found in reverse transcriptase/Reverse transcriptase (RNA-dependent DNA polymerase)